MALRKGGSPLAVSSWGYSHRVGAVAEAHAGRLAHEERVGDTRPRIGVVEERWHPAGVRETVLIEHELAHLREQPGADATGSGSAAAAPAPGTLSGMAIHKAERGLERHTWSSTREAPTRG